MSEAIAARIAIAGGAPVWVTAIPAKTISEANRRANHYARAARVKRQRTDAGLHVQHLLKGGPPWPANVLRVGIELTRFAPSQGVDDDNLRSALKGIRDGIADAIEVDDGDGRIVWTYAQRTTPKGVYFVLVALQPIKVQP